MSTTLRQLEQVFGEGEDCAVEALDFRVRGFDHVVFVRRMCAAAVAETEMAGGQAQRFASENISGPGTGIPRPHDGIDAMALVNGDLRANQRSVGRRGS